MPEDLKIGSILIRSPYETEKVVEGKKLEVVCEHLYTEVRNYSMMWHDGDIHCIDCGKFIRTFDAG